MIKLIIIYGLIIIILICLSIIAALVRERRKNRLELSFRELNHRIEATNSISHICNGIIDIPKKKLVIGNTFDNHVQQLVLDQYFERKLTDCNFLMAHLKDVAAAGINMDFDKGRIMNKMFHESVRRALDTKRLAMLYFQCIENGMKFRQPTLYKETKQYIRIIADEKCVTGEFEQDVLAKISDYLSDDRMSEYRQQLLWAKSEIEN